MIDVKTPQEAKLTDTDDVVDRFLSINSPNVNKLWALKSSNIKPDEFKTGNRNKKWINMIHFPVIAFKGRILENNFFYEFFNFFYQIKNFILELDSKVS